MTSRIRWSLRRGGEASRRPVIRCLHLSAHAALVIDKRALSHTPCDARRQRTSRSSSSACVLLAGVPPFFSFLSGCRGGLFPFNKARSQPACRQLLSGPGGSGLHGGASAASAVQQMQKREKSFGKMLTLRFGLYERHGVCV